MMTMSATPGRNAGIDVLRGLSIVLVVIHHMAIRIPLARTGLADILPLPVLNALARNGQTAVTMFFVISGFLITGTTLRRWGSLSAVSPVAFSRRRAARIMPCLLVLIVLLSILDLLHIPDYTITHKDQTLPRAIFSAFAMHLNWYEARTGYLPGGWDVLWSLSIEELFYCLFPVACLTGAWFPRLLPAFCAALALSLPILLNSLSSASEIWQDKAYLPGMATIATGICAALIASRMSPETGRQLRAPLGIIGSLTLAVCLIWHHTLWVALGNSISLLLTFSVAALLIAFHQGWVENRIGRGTGWLRSFGKMSYEVYLSHMFIVFPAIALFHRTGGDIRTGWLWFIPVLALSWCLGRAVYLGLSRPADKWFLKQARPVIHAPA
ncbi:acyltransferase family protein [Acetobacter oeni]|uniref:Acyltransferase n=1 Tax=Acetobacter oeni TaxID=304077 RepID=A0A511XHK3_9PROT|nr:acyltransferase [Acetobacter oeni]MBB3881268.1 peptidoglycan/LPS O-acetylase OafA/YrhL [Acetobacter oeni]NHO18143.1 acyltransferase family protein [Acetobacter oeni]GBR08151.1 lipopolysaccharide modification acyltransferase [Acetobacter oeni LMG 21952]GEN62423.1 acyltransferase [Acetobacter oeni]